VHSCDLDGLAGPHTVLERQLQPPSHPDSLSQFLLGQFGLGQVLLKEAPTQSASGTDRLSVRDVLRLMHVEHQQLDNGNLLLESSVPVVRLKHEQVLDLMFLVHDNAAASLAAELKAIETDITGRERDLQAIESFLAEQQVPTLDELRERAEQTELQIGLARDRLAEVETEMSATAEFGDQQRSAYQGASQIARRLANERRELKTQLDRLTALLAQYDQDVKKLGFAREASLLFDPLTVQVCPWCLQAVDASALAPDDECSVCHQHLPPTDESVDVDRELRAVRARQKELVGYLGELVDRERTIEQELAQAGAEQTRIQKEFDEAMEGRFSPFIAQRDAILDGIGQMSADQAEVRRLLGMLSSRERRRQELGGLRQREQELKTAQDELGQTTSSREVVVERLSTRFADLLAQFHFPKLSDAHLDSRYVPYVRGLSYNQLGSAGATTLISLGWYLSIFEESVATAGPHPGLLMIDSPQKNLIAAGAGAPDDYQEPAIARGVYEHIVQWARGDDGQGSQVILVDNDPPAFADPYVVVRFSGEADRPPYGLIEDALG
jgi:hypothetical protein